MRKLPDHSVPRQTFGAAVPAPRILLGNSAFQHHLVMIQALPGGGEPQPVQQAETIKVRGSEGSINHVEVFLIGSLVTPIIERPRPLSAHRHAARYYTPIYKEPL